MGVELRCQPCLAVSYGFAHAGLAVRAVTRGVADDCPYQRGLPVRQNTLNYQATLTAPFCAVGGVNAAVLGAGLAAGVAVLGALEDGAGGFAAGLLDVVLVF